MTDWLSVKHQVEEFHRRHGGEAYPAADGTLVYITGATRSREDAMWTPPAANLGTERGKFDVAARRLTFYQTKLAHFVRKFDSLRETLEFSRPNDEEFALRQLQELAAIVKAAQEEVRKAQADVDATAIGKQRKAMRNHPQTEAVERDAWRDRVGKVRV